MCYIIQVVNIIKNKNMKKLNLIIIFLGLFLLTGKVSASNVEYLQPAEDLTYNENIHVISPHTLSVEGAGYFEGGLHINSVTFFNGTAVNNTTNADGEDNPFTIGDNTRIDGLLFRTEIGGDHPLKVADSIVPAADNLNDLGSSDLRFKDLYLSGNIYQERAQGGTVKALVYGSADGGCERSWTYNGSDISCEKKANGFYSVGFDFKIDDRYWEVAKTSSEETVDSGINIVASPTYTTTYYSTRKLNPVATPNNKTINVVNRGSAYGPFGTDAEYILTIY